MSSPSLRSTAMKTAMATAENSGAGDGGTDWAADVLDAMKARGIRTVATVPDGGLIYLLERCEADPEMRVITLSREDEGIGLLAGLWLGGERGVLLMQSSGAGNCVNALSLPAACRIPCLMLVTMRGEWGEFNPWQVPMGRAVENCFSALGVHCFRAHQAIQVGECFGAAADLAFYSSFAAAVLVGQRVIGAKSFQK